MNRFYSLRFRMMLLFTALAGLLLSGTSLAFYALLSRTLTVQFDQRLLAAARLVVSDLTPDPSEDDLTQVNTPGDDDVTKLDIPEEYFELLDENGHVVQQSKTLVGPPLELAGMSLKDPGPVFRPAYDRRYGPLRMVLIAVRRGGARRLLLMAMPAAEIEKVLADFRRWLAFVLPAALLFAATVSVWYASRSLRPIADLTHHAAGMAAQMAAAGGSGPWKQLPVPNTDDELRNLAVTFNGLFEQIETVVSQLHQFVTDASHELRTPLTVLLGETELTLSAPRSADEYRGSIESMQEELHKLSQIVKDLFTLSMADAGQLPVTKKPLYLNEVLEQSCAMASPLGRAKGIVIERHLGQEILLSGDEAVLRRLFLIFLDNAIKYSPPGTRVNVNLKASNSHITIEFRDQGVGISEEHLPHIFDRFYRAPSQAGAVEGGGLGLAIAQALVRTHGGEIQCASSSGHGSIFTVHLPTVLDEAPFLRVSPEEQPS